MTWKKILKIDMQEARRLGDRYASEDMDAARNDVERIHREEVKPAILTTLKLYMNETDEQNIRRFRESIVNLFRRFPNAPRLVRSTTKEAKEMNRQNILDYFESKGRKRGTTSLIDRAKKANRDDPRMGSGRR